MKTLLFERFHAWHGRSRRAVTLVLLALAAAPAAWAVLADIYPDPRQAQGDLTAALHDAAATHRRVIVDFGGNWCTDCHVLDTYFRDATNAPLVAAGFVVVHVNVGHMDENLPLAERCHVPLHKGVPALAVLDGDGKVLYSQTGGEFENMRAMKSSQLTEFLQRWRPPAKP